MMRPSRTSDTWSSTSAGSAAVVGIVGRRYLRTMLVTELQHQITCAPVVNTPRRTSARWSLGSAALVVGLLMAPVPAPAQEDPIEAAANEIIRAQDRADRSATGMGRGPVPARPVGGRTGAAGAGDRRARNPAGRPSLGGREPRAAAVHQRRRRCRIAVRRGRGADQPDRGRRPVPDRRQHDHVVDRRVRGGAGRPREEAGRAGQQAGADRAGGRDARGHAGQGARGRRGVHPVEAGTDQGRPDQGGARGPGSGATPARRRTARRRRGRRASSGRARGATRRASGCRCRGPPTGGGCVGRQLGWVERRSALRAARQRLGQLGWRRSRRLG